MPVRAHAFSFPLGRPGPVVSLGLRRCTCVLIRGKYEYRRFGEASSDSAGRYVVGRFASNLDISRIVCKFLHVLANVYVRVSNE